MKFTLSWLKDHLDTNKDLETIVDTLTNIGLEIESVEDKSKDFNLFKITFNFSAFSKYVFILYIYIIKLNHLSLHRIKFDHKI